MSVQPRIALGDYTGAEALIAVVEGCKLPRCKALITYCELHVGGVTLLPKKD
jgi:hypothetical protein